MTTKVSDLTVTLTHPALPEMVRALKYPTETPSLLSSIAQRVPVFSTPSRPLSDLEAVLWKTDRTFKFTGTTHLPPITAAEMSLAADALEKVRAEMTREVLLGLRAPASMLSGSYKSGPLTNKNDPVKLTPEDTTADSTPTTRGRMAKQNSILMTNPNTGANETQYIDVELHGVVVPLLEIKRVLRQDRKLKQQDMATLTANFNGGTPLHQTSVSNYLIGKVAMNDVVLAMLEDLFDPAEAEAMSKRNPTQAGAPRAMPGISPGAAVAGVSGGGHAAAPQAQQPQAAPPRPSFSGTLNVVGGSTPAAMAPTPHVATTTTLTPFAEDRAYELAAAVRKAEEKGEITATFSLRKLIAWGRGYYLLQTDGYSPQEAMSGAFHLAVEGKTFGEDQRFLKDLFQAKFGFESKPPRENSRTALKEGRHPMSYLIEPFIREGLHVWLHGPTGAGKTHSVFDIAERLGKEVIRFQGKGDATTDDFVGGFGLVEKNGVAVTEFQYGPLPKAMMTGAILNVDEITALPAEVLFELQAVLEGKPLVLTKNRGEKIHPQPGFAVVAADNSLGLGEATAYVGTNVMNEAFRDRFYFIHYGYMPEAMEKFALKRELQDFYSLRGWTV